MPVLFKISVPYSLVKPPLPVRQYRIITPVTAEQFSAAYQNSGLPIMDNCSFKQNVDHLLTMFNVTCTNVLDMAAPFRKTKRSRPKTDPWLNKDTRAIRRTCRKPKENGKRQTSDFLQYVKRCSVSLSRCCA